MEHLRANFIPLILVALCALFLFSRNLQTVAQQSGREGNEALDYILRAHFDKRANLASGRVMYATWFPGGPRIPNECEINAEGQACCYRSVYNWAAQNSRTAQLTREEIKEVQKSLHELPETPGSPPVANMLILSFRDGENWITRYYDRLKLPDGIKRICKIAGVNPEKLASKNR